MIQKRNCIKMFQLILVGLSILVGYSIKVDAIIPVTYTCCVNYSYSNGSLIDNFEYEGIQDFETGPLGGSQIDGFEDISGWLVTGGKIQTDIVNKKEGQQGMKIISDWANLSKPLNRTIVDKAINYNFSNTNYFGIWLYIPDTTNFSFFRVYFTSSGTNWNSYFTYSKYTGFKNGWNKLVFDKTQFTNNNESWDKIMNRVRIAVYPTLGGNTNATVDDSRFDNNWMGGGKGYDQKDTENFKEGTQGLQLITYDVNGSTLDKVIQRNFANTNNFAIWTYIDDASNITFIRLYISSNGSLMNTFFYDGIYQNYNVKSGWNKLVFNKHDFKNYGENWNNVMNKIRLSIGTRSNSISTGVTFDDLRNDITGQRAKLMIEFDDGEENIYKLAFPILRNNNQTATEFIVPDWIEDPPVTNMNVSQLHDLQNAGWDISSHTFTHGDQPDYLLNLSDNGQLAELNNSYSWLVDNNFQKTAGFIAYPFGSFDDRLIKNIKKRYIFGRATVEKSAQQHFSSDDDAEMYIQRIISIHNDTTLQMFKDKLNDTINAKLLGTILLHNMSNTNPDNDPYVYLTSDFQKLSDYIKSRSDVDVVTESDYVIPNINSFTPVINKTTRIYSNGTSVMIIKNKLDEYMPNMTVNPLSDYIEVGVTTYNDNAGLVIFNESSQNTNLQVSYDIGDRIPNRTYKVDIYWANGTKFQIINVTANSTGHINYNSTGFITPRYQMISSPLFILDSSPINDPITVPYQTQQFQIWLSRQATITWVVNGNIVKKDSNILTSIYSNSTIDTGIYNVTAIVDDGSNSSLKRTWNWTVLNDIYNIVHQRYIYQKQNVIINYSLDGYAGMTSNLTITSPSGVVTTNSIVMQKSFENESYVYTGVNELGIYRLIYSTQNFSTSSTIEYKQKPIITFVSASDLHYGIFGDINGSGFTINRFISDINNQVFFPSPDFVALVGDTADNISYINGSKILYDKLNVPYNIVIGNHESTTINETTFESPGYIGQTFYNVYSPYGRGKYNYTMIKGDYTFVFGGIASDYLPFTNNLGNSFGYPGFSNWLEKALENNAYKPTIAFSHLSAQQPRDDIEGQYIWEGVPFGTITREIFEKYNNMPVEFSGDGHIVSKNLVNNITYVIDGAIINKPYVFDYVEIYPDKIQVHTIPFRLDTDNSVQYEGVFYSGTDSKHTNANYSLGNPDENDFTITLVNITSTKLTNLWNFTANNVPVNKMALGNNHISSSYITVNLSPYESRDIINMSAYTTSDSIATNVTTFNDTMISFNQTAPISGTQVFYNIGDMIPNQTYSVKTYYDNGTLKQYLNIVANESGYISFHSTIYGIMYQEIILGQLIDSTFTVTLPIGYSFLRFNASGSTVTNLNPDGQNGSIPIFNINNNGNVNQSFMVNLSETVQNVTIFADLNNNFSVGKIEINTSSTTIIPNLIPGSNQDIWMIMDANNAPVTNTNKTLTINSSGLPK